MKLLYIGPNDPAPWRAAVARHLPDAALFVWGEDDVDLDAVDYALAWQPPPASTARAT